jgi:hypothetical protein
MAKNEVAKATPSALGPVIDYGAHQGSGFEGQTSADVAIPFLNVLQSNSPQVSKANKEVYITGAEAGMFHNTVTNRVIDGDQGVVLVPVYTEHAFVLWRPRDEGGGFAGKLSINDPKVGEILGSGRKNDKGIPLTEDGLEMKETFYIYALTLSEAGAMEYDEIIVIPFVSTKIKKYRRAMGQLRSHKQLARAPLFAHQLRITTVGDKNAHGSFYNVELTPAVESDEDAIMASALPPGHPMLETAAAMKESIVAGTRTAAYESVSGDPDGESGDRVF